MNSGEAAAATVFGIYAVVFGWLCWTTRDSTPWGKGT